MYKIILYPFPDQFMQLCLQLLYCSLHVYIKHANAPNTKTMFPKYLTMYSFMQNLLIHIVNVKVYNILKLELGNFT